MISEDMEEKMSIIDALQSSEKRSNALFDSLRVHFHPPASKLSEKEEGDEGEGDSSSSQACSSIHIDYHDFVDVPDLRVVDDLTHLPSVLTPILASVDDGLAQMNRTALKVLPKEEAKPIITVADTVTRGRAYAEDAPLRYSEKGEREGEGEGGEKEEALSCTVDENDEPATQGDEQGEEQVGAEEEDEKDGEQHLLAGRGAKVKAILSLMERVRASKRQEQQGMLALRQQAGLSITARNTLAQLEDKREELCAVEDRIFLEEQLVEAMQASDDNKSLTEADVEAALENMTRRHVEQAVARAKETALEVTRKEEEEDTMRHRVEDARTSIRFTLAPIFEAQAATAAAAAAAADADEDEDEGADKEKGLGLAKEEVPTSVAWRNEQRDAISLLMECLEYTQENVRLQDSVDKKRVMLEQLESSEEAHQVEVLEATFTDMKTQLAAMEEELEDLRARPVLLQPDTPAVVVPLEPARPIKLTKEEKKEKKRQEAEEKAKAAEVDRRRRAAWISDVKLLMGRKMQRRAEAMIREAQRGFGIEKAAKLFPRPTAPKEKKEKKSNNDKLEELAFGGIGLKSPLDPVAEDSSTDNIDGAGTNGNGNGEVQHTRRSSVVPPSEPPNLARRNRRRRSVTKAAQMLTLEEEHSGKVQVKANILESEPGDAGTYAADNGASLGLFYLKQLWVALCKGAEKGEDEREIAKITRQLRTTKILIGSLKEEIRAVEVGMIHSRRTVKKAEIRRDTMRRTLLQHIPGLTDEVNIQDRKDLHETPDELEEKEAILRALTLELEEAEAELTRLLEENARLLRLLEALRPPPPPPEEPVKRVPKGPDLGDSTRQPRSFQRKFTMNLKVEDDKNKHPPKPPKPVVEIIQTDLKKTVAYSKSPTKLKKESPGTSASGSDVATGSTGGTGTCTGAQSALSDTTPAPRSTKRTTVINLDSAQFTRFTPRPPALNETDKEEDESKNNEDEDQDREGGSPQRRRMARPMGPRSAALAQVVDANRDFLGLPVPRGRTDIFPKLVPSYSWVSNLFLDME